MISVEDLLKPVSDAKPCGDDCAYHPTFQQLENLVKGTPEVEIGNVKQMAEDPNWKELCSLVIPFFGQAKHLTGGVILSLALLKIEGFPGYCDGLLVVRGLVEKYWDAVHPVLDPEDKNDPTQRMNILANLASSGEPYRFVFRLQETPICQSPSLGRVTFRDILAARNRASNPAAADKTGPDNAQIEAAFRDSDPALLKANHEALTKALETIKGLDAFVTGKVGAGRGANFEKLNETLAQIQRSIVPFIPAAASEAAPGAAPAQPGQTAAPPPKPPGTISSREDVILTMEKICEYYQQHEPSSPLPFFLRRAQRMVKMNFMEILNELTPDAVSKVKVITGPDETGANAPKK